MRGGATRGVVAAALLAWAFAAHGDLPAADPLEWRFRVLLDDREIGFHDFRVIPDGASTRVESEASFDVKILFFKAFRYRHRNVETWEGNCLTGITATTDVNGERVRVTGAVGADGFAVSRASGDALLPDCPMSFAYWNRQLLDATALLNTQTGELEPVEIVARGATVVRYADASLPALRYDVLVRGKPISLYYGSQDGRWLALETAARGDRVLRYEPRRIPSPADVAVWGAG